MRVLKIAFITLISLTFVGCAKDQDGIAERLDKFDEKLDRIEKKLAQAPQARGQQRPKRRGPQPGTVYSIPVDGAPFKGNPEAKVTIVKVMEFACPACEQTRPFVDQILAQMGDRVKISYKNFIVHPGRAEVPAYAACAANKQGKYGEMEELIWDEGFKARKLDKAHMRSLAGKLGLDLDRFDADMNGSCVEIIRKDHSQMKAIGTSGTPTFFVNGKVLTRRSLDGIKAMVDAEEKQVAEHVSKGGKASDYYAERVVKKGKKAL